MKRSIAVLLLCLLPAGHALADEAAKADAVRIVEGVVAVCKEQGMSACQPYIHGMDIVFQYVALFEELDRLDAAFAEFVETRYPPENGISVDFDLIQASLNLRLDLTFQDGQFEDKIVDAMAVDGGYDVDIGDGMVMQIRKREGEWHFAVPPALAEPVQQLSPYYLAAQLKRSILIYRSLEAELAGLTRDQLEEKVSQDIAPILLAMLPEEEVPAAVEWFVRDVQAVLDFYSQFDNPEQMRAHIVSEHNL